MLFIPPRSMVISNAYQVYNRMVLCFKGYLLAKVEGGDMPDRYSVEPYRVLHTAVLKIMVELRGFEPLTPCLQSRCSPN